MVYPTVRLRERGTNSQYSCFCSSVIHLSGFWFRIVIVEILEKFHGLKRLQLKLLSSLFQSPSLFRGCVTFKVLTTLKEEAKLWSISFSCNSQGKGVLIDGEVVDLPLDRYKDIVIEKRNLKTYLQTDDGITVGRCILTKPSLHERTIACLSLSLSLPK